MRIISKTIILSFFFLLFISIYIVSTPPVLSASETEQPSTTDTYKFLGVNIHGLVSKESAQIEHILNYLSSSCGTNVIRIFFTSAGGDINKLKQILDFGNQYNITFIITLADYANRPNDLLPFELNESPTGWYRDGYKQTYVAHVEKTVAALKDHPAIYAWELANEPHCNGNTDCVEPYHTWVTDMSRFIRSIDTNHHISIGTMAWRNIDLGDNIEEHNGIDPQYERNNALSSITVLTGHYYSDDFDAQKPFILKGIDIGEKLQKPYYVGEAGLLCGGNNCTLASQENEQTRAELVKQEIADVFNAGATGYLLWQYSDRKNSWIENDPFSFFEGDPICSVMQESAQTLKTGGSLPGGTSGGRTLQPINNRVSREELAIYNMNQSLIPGQAIKQKPADQGIISRLLNAMAGFFQFNFFTPPSQKDKFYAQSEGLQQSNVPEGVIPSSTSPENNLKYYIGSPSGYYGVELPSELHQSANAIKDYEKRYEKSYFPENTAPVTGF